ncbi:MAG: antitoxin VapB family protein [Tepidisphaeraceae bacterium]|jgi:predicted CopG family antitoxin
MATKTITIDTEAYRRLKTVKQSGESFSQTIKRVVHKPIDFKQWMRSIEKDPLSDRAVDAVEAVVSGRRNRRSRRRFRGAA